MMMMMMKGNVRRVLQSALLFIVLLFVPGFTWLTTLYLAYDDI